MDFNRIIVTADVRSANGVLRVEKGAVGTIRSRNQGYVGVVFDEGQTVYIEPDGGGRLSLDIPFRQTAPAPAHDLGN